jgi:uncharacterized Zn-binding protein involved in type VI secretion
MPKIARINDLGHGECKAGHPDVPVNVPKEFTTTFLTGANSVFLNGKNMAIVGSIGETDCGHTTTAISGSNTVFAENVPVHRLNDVGVINEGEGEYHVLSTADNEYAGG